MDNMTANAAHDMTEKLHGLGRQLTYAGSLWRTADWAQRREHCCSPFPSCSCPAGLRNQSLSGGGGAGCSCYSSEPLRASLLWQLDDVPPVASQSRREVADTDQG